MISFKSILDFKQSKGCDVMDAENIGEVLELAFGRARAERALQILSEGVF